MIISKKRNTYRWLFQKRGKKKHFNAKIIYTYSGKTTTGSHFDRRGDYRLIIREREPKEMEISVGVANFPFVNGRCHFSERSLPFITVDYTKPILTKIKVKKEKKNIYKRKLEEKKSPKISKLELGFLALTLNRTLTRTLTHMTSETQLPVTATFWVLRPNECNSELKNGNDRLRKGNRRRRRPCLSVSTTRAEFILRIKWFV